MRFAFASLAVHALLVGAMAWVLAHDSGQVEGAAGLAGNARTRFDVTVVANPPEPEPKPEPVKITAPEVAEGLPVDVKNPHTREIDVRPPPPEPPVGQAGSGSVRATKVGDSGRTNRLGLYLRKMQRKIQSNLGPAGYLDFPTHAKLLLDLRRDGNVTKITVTESSGDAALDRLAIRAVEKSLPFDPWERDQHVELPVVFRGAQ
jgi:TonB family protein